MKKLVSFFTPVLLLVWVLACNRQSDTIIVTDTLSPESLINEAKLAFGAQVTHLSTQARVNSSRANSFSASKWRPQWAKAVTFDYQGAKVIEVPMLYGQSDPVYKTKTDYKVGSIHTTNGVTKAVFFKHKDGKIGTYIMEFILEDGYFASKRANNQYKELSLQNLTRDFTGILNFTDLLRNSLANYRYEQGRLKALSKKSINTNKNARMSYCELSTECYTIETTVQLGCCSDGEYNYNPTGNCCADAPPPSTRYDTYCENVLLCYPDPLSEPTNPGSPGDNPPTDPDNGNTASTMDIEKDGLEPCNSYVYDKIVSANMPSMVLDIVKNFDVRKDLTILLKDDNIGPQTLDGDTHQGNANTWEVTLNTKALTGSSQEYIAATIIHEILHVYLGTGNDPDHETMAQKYVVPMANALINMGFNITNERAQALAWGGLQKTTAWQELVNIDRVSGTHKTQDILNVNAYYKAGTAGLGCP